MGGAVLRRASVAMEMKWFRSRWLLVSNAKLSFCDAFMGPF